MLEWINWGDVESTEVNDEDIEKVIYLILISLIIILLIHCVLIYEQIVNNPGNSWNYFNQILGESSLIIGLFGVIFAISSIRSSSKKFKEIQVDYWNARGIDDNRKGDELLKKRDYDKATLAYKNAIDAFDKASKLDPLYAKSWSNRGNSLLALKRYDEAIEAFRHAIELDSQSSRTQSNYGLALYTKRENCRERGEFLTAHMNHEFSVDAFKRSITKILNSHLPGMEWALL